MSGKLFLLLGAALIGGVLLVMLLGVQRELDDASPVLVSTGRILLEQDGVPVLEEVYALEFDPGAGYLLNSLTEVVIDGEHIVLAQQTRYDQGFQPMEYQLVAQTADGMTLVSAYLTEKGLEMQVQDDGIVREAVAEAGMPQLALLDHNVMGQYVVLLHAIRAEVLDRTFTAAIPQALLSTPCHVEGPYTVVFAADDDERHGRQFNVRMGDAEIRLIVEDGQLVALANEARGIIGYDILRYPTGVSLGVAGDEEHGAP